MRLKRIKLAGFKSFVDPTSIPFPDDMTAIVGPNGCGKSNVIDAVRWVLGESSAKNLRGDAMTDVIFNGSSARKPVSQCSVELVFDNSSGRIQGEYANYNELSVKRLVTRDAQSNYFLNASKCRRRDVTDLFLGTGLGPRSYAIIEQGMISRLIESKPQELRVFIEEAAGISKYKERRRETENRIRHTKENLERLEDVRGELGQQLEKLQRQAAAARRYKELKSKERTYKGELAAIRWLKHSQHIASLEQEIQQKDADIEAFVAQQRGDERGIATYREQQQDLKQALSDIQQKYFKIGTDITRLEQNQIHAKQRRQQIEQELQNLIGAIDDAQHHELQEKERLEELLEQLAQGEPEQEMLEEQLLQAQENLLNSESALMEKETSWRQQEQSFNQLKQQVQAKHGQIQSTMNMQMRTQQRIGELDQELNELEHDLLAEQLASLQEQVLISKERFEDAKQHLQLADDHKHSCHEQTQQLEQSLLDAKGDVQRLGAEEHGLQTILSALSQESELSERLKEQDIKYQELWATLNIQSGWEKAFETVCAHWQTALVVEQDLDLNTLSDVSSGHLLLKSQMTENIPSDSLAAKLENNTAPQWLCDIKVTDNIDFSLPPGNYVTKKGEWFGPDWLVLGADEGHAGTLESAARLKALQGDIEAKQLQLKTIEQSLETARGSELDSEKAWQATHDDFKQAEQAHTQHQNQANLLQMQHQQSLSRQSRISEELDKQRDLLEQEKMQSEELAIQVEELEMQLSEMEMSRDDVDGALDGLKQKVESHRLQVEDVKNKSHQLALQMQGVKSQYQSLVDGQQRSQQQLVHMQERRGMLQEEFDQLSMPMEEQAETLAVLLEQRVTVEAEQTEVSDKLAEVEGFLSEAEKGQQGIMDKIQQMRSALESSKLECEGYRVRANGVLEQLQELQQPLKPLLEQLPDDAEESVWQAELEKTTASISRLGAVNLAAVEEFEVQSERKKHLDDQNDDLTAALETLENAIRKIDKETRTRFRETYDKVNNDLKGLFPKVFGGGSAYLELTDDDLLETGVTIMARPPGKKNSTIHLLSGGEKALTALSLVFAIFRLNPAPFCLLDEVDAPLDDANVGRFCKLVSEMSKSVQFIYITHNKIAMEMAKHLTGVTMAEPGVSRMVAVDVDEAVAIANA